MPPPMGSTANLIDLTICDASDSDTDSIDGGIFGSALALALDADSKPLAQTPNTSGSSHNGEQTTNSARARSSSDEDQDSDENDMRACISLLRKRKNSQPDSVVALKKSKPSDSCAHISTENTPSFDFQQLKNVSALFGQPKTSDRRIAETPMEQTNKNENRTRKESVVNHPWLLHHVRPSDSRTVPSKTPSRPEKHPKANTPKQPAVRKASSAGLLNSTPKKRHSNFEDLIAPNQKANPKSVATEIIASNRIAHTSITPTRMVPRPTTIPAFTNKSENKSKQARPGKSITNQMNIQTPLLGLGTNNPGNKSQHRQQGETETRFRRAIQVSRPLGGKRAEHKERRPKLAKILHPMVRPRFEASQPRQREIGGAVFQTECQLPKAPRLQPSTARVCSNSQPSKHSLSNFFETRPPSKALHPTQKNTNSNTALAETTLLSRAQEPQHPTERSKFYPQPTRASDSRLTASQKPLSNDIAQQSGYGDWPEIQKWPDVHTPAINNRPIPRLLRTGVEVFDNAAADIQALYAQYEKKRTTTLVDSLPANMITAQSNSHSRAKAARAVGIREKDKVQRQEKLFRNQLSRIRQKVRRDYPDETEEVRNGIIEARFDTYKDNKIRRDLNERERFKAGLPTVDFLEDNRDGGAFNGEEVDLNARRVPASQALEPTQTIVHYPVYMTEPLDEGKNYENFLKRTNSFGKLGSANFYAKRLLEGPSSPTSKRSRNISRQVVSQSIIYSNGLLFGSVKLGDGRGIYVVVRKEEMLFGNLDPDALRNKWIDEDVLDLYRKRYDIWSVKLVPKAWLDKEADDEEARAARDRTNQRAKEREKRQEERQSNKRQQKVSDKGTEVVAGDDDPQGLEGAKLRAALEALSNPTSTRCSSADNESDEGSADESNEDVDDDADDEAQSQASDETLRCENRPSAHSRPYGSPYARYPNFYEDYAVRNECVASYTDLHLANEQALDLARQVWRPRTALMDAVLHYENLLLPTLRSAATELNDKQALELQFPEFPGHKDHRPWGFVWAQILVRETELRGPRELGVDFVVDISSSAYRPTVAERAALNVDMNVDEQDGDGEDLVEESDSEREGRGEGSAAGGYGDDGDDEDEASEED